MTRLSFAEARRLKIDEKIIREAEEHAATVSMPFGWHTMEAQRETIESKPKRAKPADGYDSKLERDFADVLKRAEREDLVHRWWHHPCGFRLAPKCYFHPDFLVEPISTDDRLFFVEIKGGWFREDAKIKTRVVAPMFPCFRWLLVTREKRNGWEVREVDHRGIGREPIHVPWIH